MKASGASQNIPKPFADEPNEASSAQSISMKFGA